MRWDQVFQLAVYDKFTRDMAESRTVVAEPWRDFWVIGSYHNHLPRRCLNCGCWASGSLNDVVWRKSTDAKLPAASVLTHAHEQ